MQNHSRDSIFNRDFHYECDVYEEQLLLLPSKNSKDYLDYCSQLFRKLKKENCFWSYDMSKMKSIKEKGFKEQLPVYDVTPYDIQEYIKQKLLEIK